MSSVVGHAAAGAAAFLACNRYADARARRMLPVFLALAIGADLDYLAVWLLDYAAHPRFTHSLVFALGLAVLAWSGTRGVHARGHARLPFVALALASLSHPLLDLLVGAHPVALLWPLPQADVAIARGVLPSAGRLDPGNYYLWRNLLIEQAILLPVFALLVALARDVAWRVIARAAPWLAPVWLACLAWSLGLAR